LAFCGNDETDDSVTRKYFLELLNFLAQHNEEIGRAFKNARGNLKLIAPSIQKDIVRAVARETTKVIVDDLGDELFAVLVDEARDVSIKEQMSVCLRRDMLCDSQMTKTIEALKSEKISSGHDLNQEIALQRTGDTRWDSHYGTILRLISLVPSVVNVLEYVEEDGNNSGQRVEAYDLLNVIQSFEFIFNLHWMKNILRVTNELSQALQRNDQDIVNAMALVKVSKQRLQNIRDDGWSLLLDKVSLFCDKHNITVSIMNDIFVSQGRSRRKAQKISNLHHFQVEIFYQVVDRQFQELNNRFTESLFPGLKPPRLPSARPTARLSPLWPRMLPCTVSSPTSLPSCSPKTAVALLSKISSGCSFPSTAASSPFPITHASTTPRSSLAVASLFTPRLGEAASHSPAPALLCFPSRTSPRVRARPSPPSHRHPLAPQHYHRCHRGQRPLQWIPPQAGLTAAAQESEEVLDPPSQAESWPSGKGE
ncbi:hypothetical protein HN51_007408, partial [Arachis hypogaea]